MFNIDALHFFKGRDPVADAFATTVRSDVVKANGEKVLFVIYKGVGTTGTSTVTVNACPDATPSARTAIPFIYRTCTTGDTWGSWTAATTSGFVTTAGSSQLYQILADPRECIEEGYEWCELNMVESVDAEVVGCILGVVIEPIYQPSGTLIA